jgi:glutaredoxin 3
MNPEVTIYTKTGCPYCKAAKEDFEKRGIQFREVNVTENPGEIDKVLKLSGGKRLVPVIVEKGNVKVGWGGA